MKKLVILPDAIFAGHYTIEGHNKVWAACVAQEQDDTQESSDTGEVVYLCVYGPYGGNLRVEPSQACERTAGLKIWQKKSREKAGKGYLPVPFQPFLASFGRPLGLDLVLPQSLEQTSPGGGSASLPTIATSQVLPALPYPAALVKAINQEQAERWLADPAYAVTEKINGERCLVRFDDQQLTAYNRKGRMMNVPPASSLALSQLDHSFVVDGERLMGDLAGGYVLFDLLAWDGEDLRELSYAQRVRKLSEEMFRVNLLHSPLYTPTLRQAQENSTAPGLALLHAGSDTALAAAVFGEVRDTGGEGVVFRELGGSYYECSGKYKFLADMDVFAYGIHQGTVSGSLKIAVVRPSDQALIEVGHVRSGLTNHDIDTVRDMLAQGMFPVFTVQYLPVRTIGLSLVEPRTGLAFLRTDKDPAECTTDQFSSDKASLIEQASPIVDVTLQ